MSVYLLPHSSTEFATKEQLADWLIGGLPSVQDGWYLLWRDRFWRNTESGTVCLFHKDKFFVGEGALDGTLVAYDGLETRPGTNIRYESKIRFRPDSLRQYCPPVSFDVVSQLTGKKLSTQSVQKNFTDSDLSLIRGQTVSLGPLELDRLAIAKALVQQSFDIASVTALDEVVLEGVPTNRFVTTYSRSLALRNSVIRTYKRKAAGQLLCLACGFDFEKTYGERGRNFIEVHHTKPLSQAELEPRRIGDVIKDQLAIPICSNCHSIVHRSNPPLSLSALMSLVESSQTNK